MARTARDPRRQAARLGLLILATACAASQEPPGGPPDFDPPVLLEVRPESTAILPGFDDAVAFVFDEVVNEQSAQNLAELFLVSPRHDQVRVSWKRSRLEVKPRGGWRPDAVYRVVLLPGVADLRGNRTREGGEVVFSTGPAIPDTRVDVTVVDWAEHRIAGRGFLEAFPLPIGEDTTVYLARADSAGDIALTRVPPGDYLLVGVIDQNGNQRRDRREAFDSMTVRLDSTASAVFWAFEHDTVGPVLREAVHVDSVTTRIVFNMPLSPTADVGGTVTALLLPDSTPTPVATVWTMAVFDSVRTAEAAARDSIREAQADSAAAQDTAAAEAPAADTTGADTAAVAARPPAVRPANEAARRGQQRPGLARETAVVADSARVAEILAQRPKLASQLIVRFAAPFTPGARYLLEARATNVAGAEHVSRTVLVVPEPPPPEPADTTNVNPDSAGTGR